MANDRQAVVGQVAAETECFTIAPHVNPPTAHCAGQREDQAGQAQPRLLQVAGDEDCGVMVLVHQLARQAERPSA